MRELTDLHCHVLPGVDDGAGTMAQSLELLAAARRDGIARVLLTPHIDPERWDNKLPLLRARFKQLQCAVAEAGLQVELALAAEVTLNALLPVQLERDELPLMVGADDTRSLLLELPYAGIPVGTADLVAWLARHGVRTVIAHPERNAAVIRDHRCLDPLRDRGALLQVTAASLLGGSSARVRQTVQQLLRDGMVTLLATDSHDIQRRPPLLADGARAAAPLIGESRAWELVSSAPLQLAANSFAEVLAASPGGVRRAAANGESPALR